MKLIKIVAAALAISLAGVATTAHADYDDRIEAQAYSDPNLDANIQKAIAIVKKKGYEVGEVDVDDRFGKPVLKVEAWKGYAQYDIVLSYPQLTIISERRDWDD